MKKPNSCRECGACKISKKEIKCSVRPKDNTASTYESEMLMWRNCPLDWK